MRHAPPQADVTTTPPTKARGCGQYPGWSGAGTSQGPHARRRDDTRRGADPESPGPIADPRVSRSDVAAEVGRLDRVVTRQLGAGPRPDDLPGLQDVGGVGTLERLGGVLLDQQDRGALLVDLPD